MNNQVIPWTLVTCLTLFVFGLTYHAENSQPPDPTYDFYDTAYVRVHIHGSDMSHDLYGRYNHILHGQRVLIKAEEQSKGEYLLAYPLYSPRPAMLYVDDEAIEIFLNPGDTTLHVELWYEPVAYAFDSVRFAGSLATVCDYYLARARRFDRVHIRSLRSTIGADEFARYAASLDSMAAWELGLLAEQEVLTELPDWFVAFERNDILYQKAFLKLSQAYNREVDPASLDQLPLDNPDAAFSYYYYLYLESLISRQTGQPLNDSLPGEEAIRRQLHHADSLLTGTSHDVFFSRIVYELIRKSEIELAGSLLKEFRDRFESKMYYRYLRKRLQDATPPPA